MDGTNSSCIGKYINDEHKRPNCKVKLEGMDLKIYTIRDVDKGDELRYNYGDKEVFCRKVSVMHVIMYFSS